MKKNKLSRVFIYTIFIIYSTCVLYPIFIMISTSFKPNLEIITKPLGLPSELYLQGYINAWVTSNFSIYFKNSLVVTGTSLTFVVIFSLMASYALARFEFKLNGFLFVYFLAGIMIPIKLGTANLFKIIQTLNLNNNLLSVIFINIAMSIPMSILILTNFVKQIPISIEESAKIDGCKSNRILWSIVLPIVKPAIATVTIMNFLPIWNDFYFPLLFLRNEKLSTIPLGIAKFFGENQTDWSIIFAGLTIASVPTILVYMLMSKHFIKGLTAGAVKG